jgi:hypothetical protein
MPPPCAQRKLDPSLFGQVDFLFAGGVGDTFPAVELPFTFTFFGATRHRAAPHRAVLLMQRAGAPYRRLYVNPNGALHFWSGQVGGARRSSRALFTRWLLRQSMAVLNASW